MATNVTLNGATFSIPAFGDTGYAQGPGNLSSYLIAIATAFLQLQGGTFTLTADANFGPNFGLISLYFKSVSSAIATAGVVRLAKGDAIDWRNNANSANLALGIDGSDNLQYASTKVLLSGAVVNADINAAAAIAYSKLNLSNSIVNADIASGAAIAVNKFAAQTANKAVATDSSGFLTTSSTTDTELGYVHGVTSAIQTQLNAKLSSPLSGNLDAGNHKIVNLANGSSPTDAATVGQIAAGFQPQVQGTDTTIFNTFSSTFVNTNTTATIAPSSASNRVKITVTGTISILNDNGTAFVTIKRGSTELSGSIKGFTSVVNNASASGNSSWSISINYIDSPATTSSTVYTVAVSNSAAGSTTWNLENTKSTIILEEIA